MKTLSTLLMFTVFTVSAQAKDDPYPCKLDADYLACTMQSAAELIALVKAGEGSPLEKTRFIVQAGADRFCRKLDRGTMVHVEDPDVGKYNIVEVTLRGSHRNLFIADKDTGTLCD